jgi:hypothetical protein
MQSIENHMLNSPITDPHERNNDEELECNDILHKYYYYSTMKYKYCPYCGILLETIL